MPKLTKRQTEVFQLIQERMNATGAPPTRAEIAQEMGFRSPNAAEDHLRALARKGVIELVPGTSRGIRLLRESGLPIVGHVAAGQPMLAEENIQSNYKINKDVFAPHADYLLKVCGDSMKDAGILNGDLLAVHAASEAQSGQIIVARIGNEITVKRFYRDAVNDHLISLKPENAAHDPIELNIRNQPLIIEGVGVGVIRQYPKVEPAQPTLVPQPYNNSAQPDNSSSN